jgi:hypothetical protein
MKLSSDSCNLQNLRNFISSIYTYMHICEFLIFLISKYLNKEEEKTKNYLCLHIVFLKSEKREKKARKIKIL